MYFRKKQIEKYDLQESYNNFKIKLIVSFCESGHSSLREIMYFASYTIQHYRIMKIKFKFKKKKIKFKSMILTI